MTSLQQSRLWAFAAVFVTLLVLALGWFLLVSPQAQSAANVRSDARSVADRNLALQNRVATLRDANARLPELQLELESARTELPVRNQTEVFSASLQSLAERNLVTVTSVTLGAPVDVTAIAQGVAADAAEALPKDVRPSFALPVTFTVQGKAKSVDAFIADVQTRGQRAMLVTKVVVVPSGGIAGGSIAASIVTSYSGFLYLSPLDAASAAEAATGGEIEVAPANG